MIGFVLFAHGSRVETANDAVREVAAELARSGGYAVAAAFLELGKPDLAGAVDSLVSAGISRIIVIPYFLTLGTHLQRDLPRLVRDSARKHLTLEMEVTPPLDGHPALLQILLDRANEGLAKTIKAV